MGRVWQGVDNRLDREVAVKVVRADLLDGPDREEAIGRFRREARVTARIAHPGVPAIFDAGLEADTDELYLVMEYLPGLSLRDLLDEAASPLPVDWTVAIGAQLASVLAAAHRAGVVHRDLKPANIIVGLDGLVKVVDFGIAAVLETEASRLTATGDKPGTVDYMAPEQIRGGPAGPATDLYALGALLFEIATGRRLFADRGSGYEVQTAHLNERPDPVRRHRSELPPELDGLVSRLLRKDPAERPEGAAEVYAALAGLLARVPASGERAGDTGDPTWAFRAPLAPPETAARIAESSEAAAPRGERDRLAEAERTLAAGDASAALSAFRSLSADLEAADPAQALHCQVRAAQCLAVLGKASAALTGLGSVIERQRRLLGAGERATLRSRRIAVDMLAALGRGIEAHRELAGVARDMAASLGPGDPDTIEAERLLRSWSAPAQAGPGWPSQSPPAPGSPAIT